MQVILLLAVKEKRKQVMVTNGVMKKYKIKIKNPVMGVPITFLDKYCPSQFEIVDGYDRPYINGKAKYRRLLIKKIN